MKLAARYISMQPDAATGAAMRRALRTRRIALVVIISLEIAASIAIGVAVATWPMWG